MWWHGDGSQPLHKEDPMLADFWDAVKVWADVNMGWLIAIGAALVLGFLVRGCF